MKKKIKPGNIILAIISIFIAVIMLAPVIWALFCSLQKEGRQIVTIWDWFKPPYTLENYPNIVLGTSTFRWFWNSFVVAVSTTILTVLVSTLAAYALAKISFKGSKVLYIYFLCGLLVPGEATIVPLFILVNNLGLINTYAGLILPSIASATTLLITVNFFKTLPDELLEAVRIDGGSELTIYAKIALPLSKPIISTVALLSFIGSWNNYLWPLLCVFSDQMFTLPIGIPTLLSIERPDYVIPMTANMVASLPMIILYLIFERQIVQGITMEGIKG
jgi:multiple sugar transport system permease protein